MVVFSGNWEVNQERMNCPTDVFVALWRNLNDNSRNESGFLCVIF